MKFSLKSSIVVIVFSLIPGCNIFAEDFGLFEEASTFSKVVYDDWQQPSVPLPTGWSYLIPLSANLQTMGYYAESFINCNVDGNEDCEVFIAHRGTTDVWDTYENFQIMVGQEPYQYYMNALSYSKMVKDYVDGKYGQTHTIFYDQTGHSLGAILSELVTASGIMKTSDYGVSDVVFESPGAKTIIENMIKQNQLPADALARTENTSLHVFANADAINTWNEQVFSYGDSYLGLEINHEDFSSIPLATIGSPGVLYYFSPYTLNQHKVDNFYNYFHGTSFGTGFIKDPLWPVGFNAGYKAYLSYYDNREYWNDYMEYMWVHNPNLHSQYQSEYDFIQDFTTALDKERNAITRHISQNAHNKTILSLDREMLNHTKPITPITAGKRPTLYDVINNNYDGKASIRRQIYASSDSDAKLYYAVMCGDTSYAKKLMNQTNVNVNTQHGTEHFSLLQIAIKFGYFDMVGFLLDQHADPNLSDKNGNNALHTVATVRYSDAAKYAKIILAAGVDPNKQNNKGETPLMLMKKHDPGNVSDFASVINNYSERKSL